MEKNIPITKIIGFTIGAIVVAFIGMRSFTVTPAGQTKVQTCFGDVTSQAFTEGLHFPVNPLCSFDIYDTREFKYEVNAISIPTQDRFNSTANVTALIRVNPASTPSIKRDFGNMDQFLDKTIRQQLRALVRDEGRKLKDSRSLAQSDKVSTMQLNLNQRLTEALKGKIQVTDVLVQDIEFDARITTQILKTQERIQKEEAENSLLRIKQTQAQQMVAEKKGQADSQKIQADADAYAMKERAKAEQFRLNSQADAQRYLLEQQAKGNEALNKSLTANIIRLKELEVKQIEAGKGWNGQLPSQFSPVYGDSENSTNAPFLLKNLK